MRILLVEDDALLGDGIHAGLKLVEHAVDWVHDGEAARLALLDHAYDACVLDLGLPKRDGLSVLKELRDRGSRRPGMILTARDASADKIAGLDAGADDYITKPFSTQELLARIRAVLRRRAPEQVSDSVSIGELVLDAATYRVTFQGQPLKVGPTEFKLLRYLMLNPNRVLSKAQILDRVWNYDFGGRSSVVELYISYLRKKIDAGRPAMIHTLRGAGYMLKPAA